ncbi:MAG: hypothetical protein AB8E74_05090 [Prochlorococcus sp.]|nr:hypothetical protein [Prochlorococcaceae cyanobacterium ETNP18_MAG_1]
MTDLGNASPALAEPSAAEQDFRPTEMVEISPPCCCSLRMAPYLIGSPRRGVVGFSPRAR